MEGCRDSSDDASDLLDLYQFGCGMENSLVVLVNVLAVDKDKCPCCFFCVCQVVVCQWGLTRDGEGCFPFFSERDPEHSVRVTACLPNRFAM